MGIFNRVINGLILLFAIVAVIFSCLLFSKREQIVSGWDKMASSINDTAKALDANSGTKLASELDKSKIDHRKYENLATALPKLKNGANAIVAERDGLANGIKTMASSLEISVTDEDAKALKEVASSEERTKAIGEKVAKVQENRSGLVSEVVNSAGKLSLTLDEASLKDVENFREPLAKFGDRVKFVKNQGDAYATFIKQTALTLDGKSPDLSDSGYSASLAATSKHISNYKSTFEQTKKDLASEKVITKKLTNDLKTKEVQYAELSEKVKKKDEIINKLNNLIGNTENPDDINIIPSGSLEAIKKIKGQIVEINPKWDFVVINVGKSNKIFQKIGQKEMPIAAPLPADKSMTVARGLAGNPEFVAKIRISKVYDDCAIANVLPSPKGKAHLQIGDSVFFSDEDLAADTAAAEKKN